LYNNISITHYLYPVTILEPCTTSGCSKFGILNLKKKHFLTHKNKTVCHYMFAIATWKRDWVMQSETVFKLIPQP
jgi:hypothetical protein